MSSYQERYNRQKEIERNLEYSAKLISDGMDRIDEAFDRVDEAIDRMIVNANRTLEPYGIELYRG